jgi:NAD(P)-dependent dehydrogenase (short-subunit alcohol dehydrogenase family)
VAAPEHRTWLITGTSTGLGRELARAALEAGDNVVATARRPEVLDDLVAEFGDQVRTVELDVTDADAARAAVRIAVDELGRLDVVVNNAGTATSSPIEETSDADFRAQVETNLFGLINVTRAALPVLRAQRSGHFIQMSSIGGRAGGTPGLGAYQTSKWAVEGFSEVLSNEVKPFGVKVVIVEPGAFRTPIWSMPRPPVGPDYDASVGATNRRWEQIKGTEPGDPARAARIIVDVVALDDPPLRLLLGAGAVTSAAAASQRRAAEAEQWADRSRAADFPATS